MSDPTPIKGRKADTSGGRTRYRTIWISDIHLGTRGCNARMLIDFLDHKYLNIFIAYPSAENIALHILTIIKGLKKSTGGMDIEVSVSETPATWAHAVLSQVGLDFDIAGSHALLRSEEGYGFAEPKEVTTLTPLANAWLEEYKNIVRGIINRIQDSSPSGQNRSN